MSGPQDLRRFINAQETVFETVLAELKAGSKQSHWMWYVFPQLAGLGQSPTAKFYGIESLDEARSYLLDDILGRRLKQCVRALLVFTNRRSAEQILGPVDAMKLKSCLTLFDIVEPGGLFASALTSFFAGKRDERTLALLNAPS